jgi:hypothetical protein
VVDDRPGGDENPIRGQAMELPGAEENDDVDAVAVELADDLLDAVMDRIGSEEDLGPIMKPGHERYVFIPGREALDFLECEAVEDAVLLDIEARAVPPGPHFVEDVGARRLTDGDERCALSGHEREG